MHRWIANIVALASVFACCLLAPADAAQDVTLALNVGGQQRIAYLHVPVRLDPAVRYPLVIGYHGGAGNASGYIRQSRIYLKGEQAGFIVACPEGTALQVMGDHRVWNSGPEYAKATRDADDVALTAELIREISARYPIDPKRVYATGFSNGGQMSYRLAMELSSKIAAIAPMSGARFAEGRQSARPVPVLHFHGTADGMYPLAGGLGPYSIGRTPHVSIPAVIAERCKFNSAHLILTAITACL